MSKLLALLCEAESAAKDAERTANEFMEVLRIEEPEFFKSVIELFGEAWRVRIWLFTPINDAGETPARWISTGNREKVEGYLLSIAHGFSG